jgi:hypothetical protein
MIQNESIRFSRHIDIEISYKVLWLEVPKLVPILYYPACFQKGLFGCSLEQTTITEEALLSSVSQSVSAASSIFKLGR